jgi:hypothetical protein
LALKTLRFLTMLAVGAACTALPGAALAAGNSTRPAATSYPGAVTGRATLMHAQPPAPAFGSVMRARGARAIPRTRRTAAPATAAPRAAGSPLATASSLIASFDGTSSRDSGATNFGQEFEPPDQGLCAGNGFVVDMVNSAYTVYRPKGAVVTGPFNINGPFNEGLTQFTSDPRCYYDASTNTWFATILFISGGGVGNSSHLDIAVNPSGDPTTVWTNYEIDTTHAGGPGCPCFGDQPTLGIDSQNLYVTTNEFSILGPQFNGAQIYSISKQDLVSLSASPHFAHFGNLNIGGTVAASVQPAITTGVRKAEYFLNSLDPNGTFDTRIGVWALTNLKAVTSGGTPTLSSMVIPSEAYGVPPNAQQRGSSSLLTTDDDRMQQTQFINGNLWGELTTGLTIPGDPVARAGAAWFQVQPRITGGGGVLESATLAHQGYVAMSGRNFIYPALEATATGAAAMVGTLSGADVYPSAAFTQLAAGGSAFGPIQIGGKGTGPYDPNATRWGDYSFAVLDPSGTSIWLATEYVPPTTSQTPDRLRNWGTRVLNVSPG